ncbi:ABC transporter permease [Acuticoccus sp. M5D2P5]|uniref:ABC transporter permease n=1 Tax=Acuticoccus kalidii TaxID=2910977 RepID=UPI001F29AAF3|nr:ABC transporter permease [Acuticoccus kalidii]MCF3934938.1 ABC transporter permease [Acuticoccus kalidii]
MPVFSIRSIGRKALYYAPPVLSFVAFIIAWQLYVDLFGVSAFILPSPERIVRAGINLGPALWGHTWTTTYEILLGFLVGNAVAVGLAYLIVRWSVAERIVYPFLIVSQTVPKLAVAPLLVIWFGTGILPKVIVTALVCFFPTAVNVVQGLRSADPNAIDLVRLVTPSTSVIFRKVQFPSSIPYFFAGLKISMAAAVIGAIVAEWVGANSGLGYLILYGGTSMRTDLMFVGVGVTVILGMVLYGAVGLAEYLISWRRTDVRTNT